MKNQEELHILQKLYPGMPIDTLSPELRAALPKDKDDMKAVARIRDIEYPAIAPILPHLISWLEDMNWPIAGEIAKKLVLVGQPMIPHIQKVLKSEDHQWKYWVLAYLVKELEPVCLEVLREDLKQISQHEDPAETYEMAGEILQQMSGRT